MDIYEKMTGYQNVCKTVFIIFTEFKLKTFNRYDLESFIFADMVRDEKKKGFELKNVCYISC
jgi:hypothetical protein